MCAQECEAPTPETLGGGGGPDRRLLKELELGEGGGYNYKCANVRNLVEYRDVSRGWGRSTCAGTLLAAGVWGVQAARRCVGWQRGPPPGLAVLLLWGGRRLQHARLVCCALQGAIAAPLPAFCSEVAALLPQLVRAAPSKYASLAHRPECRSAATVPCGT